MEKPIGICRLCKKHRELLKSHIIPEFMYEELYDEIHRMRRVNLNIENKKKFEQKGIRERLFCQECEKIFQKYENYAAPILKDLDISKDEMQLIYKNVD